MSIIDFTKKNRPALKAEVAKTLMQNLLDAKIPVASSCQGDGVCAKCKVLVNEGAQNLSHPTEAEQFLMQKNKIPEPWRLSCQCYVLGDVTLDTGYW
jgi:2Fe-2S ferredoxin